MAALLILFAVLGGVGALLTIVLLRRGGGRTDTVDGILQEQQALHQAKADRVSFGLGAHNSLPTASDSHIHRKGRP
ncbi:hypothetical protein [Streptomyces sp. TLI_105]|uniref:hypothetical protein n=1 Tax=Streptomyces sp. TLI_105 TaxID=1881019 RepID=UPI0008944728|nr:hypothetical protein [Streptomyces sp. TLI_105]SEB91698.1 hypothetical protein SAMN05428939_1083 [Streptomyces sp. TLI_105]